MAILPLSNKENHEQNKFKESSGTPGQVGVVVVNPDGSNIAGGSGGSGTAAYSDSGGTDKKGLVDSDRHVQVDVLTMPAATIDTTGLATSAKQDTLLTELQAKADLTETQPVSAASLPLPALAATSTKQSDGTQKTQVVDGSGNVIGATSNALDINIKSGNPTTMPVTNVGTFAVQAASAGDAAHDAVDAGNPVKIGGKVSTSIPTAVADADRVNAWYDEYGRLTINDKDTELGLTSGTTGLRDRLVAQRCTVLSDSLADGIAGFWTQTTANGGTVTTSGGEGLLKTSTAVNGSAQIVSTNVAYFPGQVAWMNSAIRFGDTGTAGDIRRLGMYTVSGTTPQEGFYFELSGTTLNAVTVKAGSATAVAQSSWTRNGVAPFTLDTNYHSFEIRYTANTVWFYIDNVLRHVVSGTSTPLTSSLTLPIAATNIKTSGATDITFAIRNIGNGRFGQNGGVVNETGLSAVEALAIGGGTPHDSVDSGNPLKVGGYAKAAAPTDVSADGDRVNAWFLRNGAQATALTAAGALIGGDATNGIDVDVTRLPALVAGSAIVGKVGIDQTTPGTTNGVQVNAALPAGANAIGKLAANSGVDIGDVDVTTINGVAPAFGSGARSASTQRVTIATDDSVPVTIATVPSHAVTNAGTFAVQAASAGDVAHDGVDSGNPIKIGGKATSSEPAAVASGDRANLITDLVGKLITLPYANPENSVSGAITSAMTGTTSTSLVAAPGAGLRNYITTIVVSNSHATVGTDVIIQDGSGGTTLMTIPAAALYGGGVIPLPVPLRQPTANTALFCANVTTGASTKVSAFGYKGA